MLRIRVIQANGALPASPASHDFDERGGTIGRDDSNALVLPDPDRHISRMQAQVEYNGSSYLLIDHGGNPTQINGRPVGKGSSAAIRDGDEIGIAGYTLRVEVLREASSFKAETFPKQAPSTNPLGLDLDLTPSSTPPVMPPAVSRSAALPPSSLNASSASRRDDDPFAVFVPAPQTQPTVATAPEDPFAGFAPRPTRQATPYPTSPLGIGGLTQPAEANSLNALFGLEQTGSTHDPFANSVLGDTAGTRTPLAGGSADPLFLLGGVPRSSGEEPTRNDSPLLRDAFTPPRRIDDAQPEVVVAQATPPLSPARSLSAPQGGVVSWAESPVATEQPPLPATEIAPKVLEAVVQPKVTPPGSADINVASPPPAAPPVRPAATADNDALLAAFSRGIGLPGLTPAGGMTPELMEHVGHMLREAVQGTVELLIARAATKREVRATNLTMILSKNNNPLKFSPDVDFALMQLLLPQGSGFMKPEEAMRDAYDDLRAHQIGFVAGMRAALASLIGRFTPAELETHLSTKSFLDNVLPANRKAKLWDLFEQRYSDISREAEDDFHSIFGREFLKAYEAQIEQIGHDRN